MSIGPASILEEAFGFLVVPETKPEEMFIKEMEFQNGCSEVS